MVLGLQKAIYTAIWPHMGLLSIFMSISFHVDMKKVIHIPSDSAGRDRMGGGVPPRPELRPPPRRNSQMCPMATSPKDSMAFLASSWIGAVGRRTHRFC